MTELAFAKQFLTALDSRPIKLSGDSVADPKTYPAQSAFILPRLPNAKRKRGDAGASTASASTQSPGAITVSLKPMKPGAPSVTLPSQPPTKSLYDIKVQYASEANFDVSKIKLLRNKKPVADSKSLRDALGEETTGANEPQKETELEFSVMVMAGAALPPAAAAAPSPNPPAAEKMDVDQTPPVPQGPSRSDVLAKDEFWHDLKGFLLQRVRDEAESEKLAEIFKAAWKSSGVKS